MNKGKNRMDGSLQGGIFVSICKLNNWILHREEKSKGTVHAVIFFIN